MLYEILTSFGVDVGWKGPLFVALTLFGIAISLGTNGRKAAFFSIAFFLFAWQLPCITAALTIAALFRLFTSPRGATTEAVPENIYSSLHCNYSITKLNGHEVLIEKDGKQVILGSEEHFYPATGHGKYYVREAGSTEHERNKLYIAANTAKFGMTQEQAAAEIVRKKLE